MKASVRCWNQNGHIPWSFEGLRLWLQASVCCSDETLKTAADERCRINKLHDDSEAKHLRRLPLQKESHHPC